MAICTARSIVSPGHPAEGAAVVGDLVDDGCDRRRRDGGQPLAQHPQHRMVQLEVGRAPNRGAARWLEPSTVPSEQEFPDTSRRAVRIYP